MRRTASSARDRSPHVGTSTLPAAIHLVSGAVLFGPPIGNHALMQRSTASLSSFVHPKFSPATVGADTDGRGDEMRGTIFGASCGIALSAAAATGGATGEATAADDALIAAVNAVFAADTR